MNNEGANAPQEWLVPGYLPLGKLVLLVGPEGVGKSAIALDTVARVTSALPGRQAFGLDYPMPNYPARTLYACCEERLGAQLAAKRLERAGGNPSACTFITGPENYDGSAPPLTLGDIARLQWWLRRMGAHEQRERARADRVAQGAGAGTARQRGPRPGGMLAPAAPGPPRP
jgi:hypothetical protein